MNRSLLIAALFTLAACGGSDHDVTNPPPKKPDPYITIRVRDMLDTTTAPGRAQWHIYSLLTGPYSALNGITPHGNLGLNDIRLGHILNCVGAGADSVGQRLITVVALADTTTETLTPDAEFDAAINAWYNGNHTLPTGWMAITFPPTDAWQSEQYIAGHGRLAYDPIKWGFDWTGSGESNFYERTDSGTECNQY